MKYCIVVPDGAADYSLTKLDGRTPLEAARTPNMDRAAREGLLGVTRHVPPRMTPGSSVAMMSVLGYNPGEFFTGRGPLEAADLGLDMEPSDWAVRCNFITASDGTLADFTAGHIETEEARLLIETLNDALGTPDLSFHTGTSYRHVMLYRGEESLEAETTPPHDIVGEEMEEYYPNGPGDEFLMGLMQQSRRLLEAHDVNEVRLDLGKNPANMIWLWSPGKKPSMPAFADKFDLTGAAISAVNLVRGIARLIGWDIVQVPGATGYVDTDFAAKGRYTVDSLNDYDVVLVHVEAPDEASHERDIRTKIQCIERIDREIVGPVMAAAEQGEGLRLLVVPDHVTSVEDGRHKADDVPFALWGEGVKAASGLPFTEAHAASSEISIPDGYELIEELIGQHPEHHPS